jgi:tripartite-type tricarboxylate transporter receptor subunit TctC
MTGSTGRHAVICGALALLCAGAALAQSFPSKPLRLVVTFPAGGAADALARPLALKLGEVLGQNVVLEHRPGAGGSVGAEAVAKAAPDGYTLLFATNGTHGINSTLYGKLPYDPVKDFAPVGLAQRLPSFLVVHPSVPVKDVREFLDYVRKQPGKVDYGSAGNGTTSHLSMELIKSQGKLFMVHIPYRGGAAAITDLLAGRLQAMIQTAPDTLPHIRSGKLRVLGVSSAERSAIAPDIPTLAEAGLPGYNVTAWTGIVAPAGTPREAVQRLAAAMQQAARAADYRERLTAIGADAVESNPEQFTTFIQAELEKWARAVRESGAKVD